MIEGQMSNIPPEHEDEKQIEKEKPEVQKKTRRFCNRSYKETTGAIFWRK